MKRNKVQFLNYSHKKFNNLFDKFFSNRGEMEKDVSRKVSDILYKIKFKGDSELLSMIKKYDNASVNKLEQIKIDFKTLKKSFDELPLKQKESLRFASKRIKDFHKKQMPVPFEFEDNLGVKLGMKFNPIESVGLYVPGGKAIYPSSVLMSCIPALVSGVKRRILVSPVSIVNPPKIVLAAAYLSEVSEFYAMGGAHAIASLAYGTNFIPKVDKIVGPGNLFVSEAKRQVFGKVGIDSIAGPSEVLIISDNKNDPNWIAYDLLSQSEHDEDAQSILITDDICFGKKVERCIRDALTTLPRKKIASESWFKNGAIIIVNNLMDSINLINQIAPEHLELSVDKPNAFLKKIKNAGSIFIGRYTPEAIGDYVAGPNHVLPTGGSARFSSGLGVEDFFKRSTFVECNKDNLSILRKHASVLAEIEGLDAHKISMDIRK